MRSKPVDVSGRLIQADGLPSAAADKSAAWINLNPSAWYSGIKPAAKVVDYVLRHGGYKYPPYVYHDSTRNRICER
jgi:hypothetical protein